MTNFEKMIGRITPDVMASYICLNTLCVSCPANGENCDGNSRNCKETILEWLNKEAGESQ